MRARYFDPDVRIRRRWRRRRHRQRCARHPLSLDWKMARARLRAYDMYTYDMYGKIHCNILAVARETTSHARERAPMSTSTLDAADAGGAADVDGG